MARRKIGNSHTTICVSWEDKELFRKFASFVKKTRTGNLYESDAVLFSKMLSQFKDNNTVGEVSNTTYPSKS
jgi:hypothetical protein|tara:strand:+ start:335 stop:550 length:216 start_codon:yes stop_codon:yes gene_type:complete